MRGPYGCGRVGPAGRQRVSSRGRLDGSLCGLRPARPRRPELVAGTSGRRRLAEDDAPAAAVVPVAVEGLPAQGAGPLDERRQCGKHHAGEGPALLGFGERGSADLRWAIAARNARP